jgi:hypothetical protein
MRITALLAVVLCAVACTGTEKGRVRFEGSRTAEESISLSQGTVRFWTDLDAEFDGDPKLTYDIELIQSGASVGHTTCDALNDVNTKVMSKEVTLGNHRSVSYQGKMSCSMDLPTNGMTTVRATFSAPERVKLAKYDIVVKE